MPIGAHWTPSIDGLLLYRRALGLRVPILVHLNNERPWRPDNPLSGHSDMISAYKAFPLVLRNYYYPETTPHSVYFPLGAGHLLQVARLLPTAAPSSQRQYVCSFAGRLQYKEGESDGALERNAFVDALVAVQSGGDGSPCYAVFSPTDERHVAKHGLAFGSYIALLRDTIFAPCPGGNNPETFRHYEVRMRLCNAVVCCHVLCFHGY